MMQSKSYPENKKTGKSKTVIVFITVLILVPLILFLGVRLLGAGSYLLLSSLVMILSCVPFFIRFEFGKVSASEMAVTAVMTALSVLGRIVFTPVPGFKPVAAMVILSGIAFGPETGFITGSMSALVSNIFFGQGPWTPFQMFAWGIIGFVSGIAARNRKKPSYVLLIFTGVIGGIVFSLLMDVWSTFAFGNEFTFSAYLGFVAASFYFMIKYIVSNVIFLLILARPLSEKFERLKVKYGIFEKYI